MSITMAESRTAPARTEPPEAPRAQAVRWFGRRQLLRLIGKSARTMAWRVAERSGEEQLLVLPRHQPTNAGEVQAWVDQARQAARLEHPQLARAIEVGVQDGWPFVVYALDDATTLADRLGRDGWAGVEAATLAIPLLHGLAFAHEGGVAHHDIQPYLILLDGEGRPRLAGLAVACIVAAAEAREQEPDGGSERPGSLAPLDPRALRRTRAAAERDVLAFGIVWHRLLAGAAALDEADVGAVIARMPPLGREVLRLPWSGTQNIAEPLRTIVNRATDRQERQRYRSARTLARALEGWLATETNAASGPLALLGDRLRHAGVLPAAPGSAERAVRLIAMDRERTNELAEVVLEDLALAFEMLRLVNAAIGRSALASGGAVMTVRRAIAMLGMDAMRNAAHALRTWPGPLDEPAAAELARLFERSKRAARLALQLRPAGYDAEVCYLVTLLQNLGRLIVQYHFADDAAQIRRLMAPAPPARAGEAEEPGMPEAAASFAVLGVDCEALGQAVARQWGLDDAVLSMIRRLPLEAPVRTPEGDAAMLRLVASCAHEAIDATLLPAPKVGSALQRVLQRYGRALDLDTRSLQEALRRSAAAASWAAMTRDDEAETERAGRTSFGELGASTRF
jgi:non-specific serine/threonine protein kinase